MTELAREPTLVARPPSGSVTELARKPAQPSAGELGP
jgi:hypothetical protein